DKQRHRHRSKQYHLSVGWPAFKRSNNISEGDECVFMYATSEDKMCLAKITKKENVDVDDNSDEDEYVELGDGMDDKDVNEDAELVDDEDPFFRVTITPSHKSMLRLPIDFVASAGIEAKENITMKSLDGNETQMSIQTDKQRHRHRHRDRSKQYHLSVGWPAFKRSNNISEGDECVFMYATSEDKMCLAKITKKENVDVDDDTDEDEYVELVDVNEDAELVDDEDPFFPVTISPSHKSMLVRFMITFFFSF
ncbi:DNA-binding pseudobarrel domain-containing protein, partial [Tanacetum coccineum]